MTRALEVRLGDESPGMPMQLAEKPRITQLLPEESFSRLAKPGKWGGQKPGFPGKFANWPNQIERIELNCGQT